MENKELAQDREFLNFLDMMDKRFKLGREKYGDRFLKQDLPKEIEEELIDVAVWSCLLYIRLQRLKKALEEKYQTAGVSFTVEPNQTTLSQTTDIVFSATDTVNK